MCYNIRKLKEDCMKENKIVSTFNMYKFILKIFAAVILIAFAIFLFVSQNSAVFMLLLITGGVISLQMLIRLFGLIKNNKCKEAKRITLFELLLEILLGVYLIISAFCYNSDPKSAFSVFASKNYAYFLAGFLYVKSVSYFWQTIIYKAEGDRFKFWLHIAFITISIFMCAVAGRFGAKEIVISLAVIAILCALLVGGEAGGGYFQYRKGKAPKKENVEKIKEEEGIEAPGEDEDIDISEIDPNIIPIDDNRDNDIII